MGYTSLNKLTNYSGHWKRKNKQQKILGLSCLENKRVGGEKRKMEGKREKENEKKKKRSE